MQEFKKLSNTDLVTQTKSLVAEERKLTASVIAHLEEIERRKIYLERGFSSLFAFCEAELGYSGDQAMRRISAMRLTREIPEARAKIEEGSLSLTNLARAQTFMREEKKAGKLYTQEAKRELVLSLEGLSSRECERKLAALAPEQAARDKVRAISETETQITFVADAELMADLQRIRDLIAHQKPNPSYLELFKKMAKLVLTKHDPRAIASVAAPKVVKASKPSQTSNTLKESTEPTEPKSLEASTISRALPPKRTRYIKSQDETHVWQRDPDGCQFVDPVTGRKCQSTFMLELDHVVPYALGGGNEPENLRILCRAHNQWEAQKVFGPRTRGANS